MPDTTIDPVPTAELSAKQQALILALIAGQDIRAASKTAGITETTAYRWLKLPHFAQAYKEAKNHVFEEALDTLKSLVPRAIDTLIKHIDAETEPTASTQARVSLALIEQAINLFKFSELEEKIAEFEQWLKQQREARP